MLIWGTLHVLYYQINIQYQLIGFIYKILEKWAWTVQKISHHNCEESNNEEYQWLKAYMLYIELREQSFSQLFILLDFTVHLQI